jgi:hypothetical protein
MAWLNNCVPALLVQDATPVNQDHVPSLKSFWGNRFAQVVAGQMQHISNGGWFAYGKLQTLATPSDGLYT